jgi:transcriptional regulator with XRE-family HTH domain
MTPQAVQHPIQENYLRDASFPLSVVPFGGLLSPPSPSTNSGLGMRIPPIQSDIENLRASADAMTNATAPMVAQFWGSYLSTTDTGITHITIPLPSPEEIRRLRDEIARCTRLTRQQIARAIGVDRRSLTAWANGSTAPGPERLERLRFLAALVRQIDALKPGHTTEVLLARQGREDLLDAIALGRYEKASAWQSRRDQPSSVRIAHRESSKLPLYRSALDAYLAGKLSTPSRAHVLRAPEMYEQDLSRAERLFPDEVPRRGRRGYR